MSQSIDKTTWELVARIREGGPGAWAALRRSRPNELPREFFRISAPLFKEESPDAQKPWSTSQEEKWIVVAAAIASGTLDDKTTLLNYTKLGHALAESKIAEQRVSRLLLARDAALYDATRSVVHFFVSKGVHFNPADLARLLLSDGAPHEREVRRTIARDYYHRADSTSIDQKAST